MLTATTVEELETKLASIPEDVGPRISGRNQERKENWVLKHYLGILRTNGRIRYPIQVTKRESPDYAMKEDSLNYGLEVTESTSEDYQMLLTENDKQPGLIFEDGVIRYGVRYSRAQILRFLKTPGSELVGEGWSGLEPDEDAANWAKDALFKKLGKLGSWDPSDRTSLRIVLYQNCPASVYHPNEFRTMAREKVSAIFHQRGVSPSDIKVDYLKSDGALLFYDILGTGDILR